MFLSRLCSCVTLTHLACRRSCFEGAANWIVCEQNLICSTNEQLFSVVDWKVLGESQAEATGCVFCECGLMHIVCNTALKWCTQINYRHDSNPGIAVLWQHIASCCRTAFHVPSGGLQSPCFVLFCLFSLCPHSQTAYSAYSAQLLWGGLFIPLINVHEVLRSSTATNSFFMLVKNTLLILWKLYSVITSLALRLVQVPSCVIGLDLWALTRSFIIAERLWWFVVRFEMSFPAEL